MRRTAAVCGLCALVALSGTPGAVHAAGRGPFTTEAERCIVPAATFHGVNYHVLRAILKVESGLKPHLVGRNTNGTLDVGIGQMNSAHFPELARWGISPGHLRDACIGTFVAAWHLRKAIHHHGNTWFGIASYHSTTPYFNNRYQILLHNELVHSGVIQAAALQVPPLRRAAMPGVTARPGSPRTSKNAKGEITVIDDP